MRRLAALSGVSPAYLSRLERGRRRLTADVADRLEAALESAPVCVNVGWWALRERADLSLCEVARRASVNCAVLSRVERGERRATVDVLQRPVKTLGTSVIRR